MRPDDHAQRLFDLLADGEPHGRDELGEQVADLDGWLDAFERAGYVLERRGRCVRLVSEPRAAE